MTRLDKAAEVCDDDAMITDTAYRGYIIRPNDDGTVQVRFNGHLIETAAHTGEAKVDIDGWLNAR